MFRLNDNYVIDATMAGGPARYINHSCNPNCFTEMIPTEKGDKIVIITKRKISTGEEVMMQLFNITFGTSYKKLRFLIIVVFVMRNNSSHVPMQLLSESPQIRLVTITWLIR